tara:strand:+ start:109 stop:294 length:186 start_codon:yes stop_codon:yes gene_type:complete
MKQYIDKIKFNKYDYETDPEPDLSILKPDINKARLKFLENIKKFGVKIKSNVFIEIQDEKI